MSERWLQLEDRAEVRPGGVEARGRIPDDSPFFSGHFPGNPMVPGIALLALVRRALAPERAVTGFRRVKFRQGRHRGGVFTVSVDLATRAFEVTAADDGERLCDGLVQLAEGPDAP
jgi:hypothetical protein